MEALLDCEKAAELLGISPWTVRKWLSTNKLRSVRLGRRVLIEPGEIRRIIDLGRDYEPEWDPETAGLDDECCLDLTHKALSRSVQLDQPDQENAAGIECLGSRSTL